MHLPETSYLASRQSRVRQTLAGQSLEALVIVNRANIRYLTNHTGSAGALVLTQDAAHLILDFRYEEAMQAVQASTSACPGLRLWHVSTSEDEALTRCLGELGLKVVGFESAHISVARHDWLTRTLSSTVPGLTLRPAERLVERARMVKDAAEIATLRDAARGIGAVADAAYASIGIGVSEREVAAAIEGALRTAGYERPAFDTIVASGPNGSRPHHRASDRVIDTGDLVVLDFGGMLDGYCCDLTRTVAVGPPTLEARRVYDAVLEANRAAVQAVRPGVEASEVDAAARDVLTMHGLGEAFGHGTGHGLGLDIHEDPRIGRRRQGSPAVVLEAGMVFTIEPGAYLPGWGGVRIEDDILVTASGCEVLTEVPRDLLWL